MKENSLTSWGGAVVGMQDDGLQAEQPWCAE